MRKTLKFNSQSCSSKHFLLQYPIDKTITIYPESMNFASKCHLYRSSLLLSHQIQIQKPIICARKRKRRSGSQKLMRILPKLVTFLASNAKILPEPLDLVMGELGGGNGGGLGFWKGFGGESSDGWGRKGKGSLRFWGLLVIFGWGVFLLLFGKELKSDVLVGVLALAFFGAFFTKVYKRRDNDSVLGLLFVVGALMGLGLRREVMQKWIGRVRVSSPVWQLMKGKSRNGRRFV